MTERTVISIMKTATPSDRDQRWQAEGRSSSDEKQNYFVRKGWVHKQLKQK